MLFILHREGNEIIYMTNLCKTVRISYLFIQRFFFMLIVYQMFMSIENLKIDDQFNLI